jgi:hypothetical protein
VNPDIPDRFCRVFAIVSRATPPWRPATRTDFTDRSVIMAVRLGDIAPDFTAPTTQ